MKNQIEEQKALNDFYEDYSQGKSRLSEIYQQNEQIRPGAELDVKILELAAIQAQQNKNKKSIFSKFNTSVYSIAASFMVFTLVGLVFFNVWEQEQTKMDNLLSESKSNYAPSVSDEINIDKEMNPALQEKVESVVVFKDEQKSIANPSMPKSTINNKVIKNQFAQRKLVQKESMAEVNLEAKAKRVRNTSHFSSSPIQEEETLSASGITASSNGFASDVANDFDSESSQEHAKSIGYMLKKDSDKLLSEQAWLKRINQLIENKEIEKAKAELAKFKLAYPQYLVNDLPNIP
ncbi:MAG: hypothetical protein HQL46_12290 [Gammaproteobacteria bacterium]|nr:hypothetical protein [Gammaproteobacteria bacterium]